jgi:hypothetical protein
MVMIAKRERLPIVGVIADGGGFFTISNSGSRNEGGTYA